MPGLRSVGGRVGRLGATRPRLLLPPGFATARDDYPARNLFNDPRQTAVLENRDAINKIGATNLAQRTGETFQDLTTAMQVSASTDNTNVALTKHFYTDVVPGTRFYIAIAARMVSGTGLPYPRLDYAWEDAVGARTQTYSTIKFGAQTAAGGAWQYLEGVTTPAPANTARIFWVAGMSNSGGSIFTRAGDVYLFTAFMAAALPAGAEDPAGYFDGTTPDTAEFTYAWTGTVNNSPSTRTP